MFSASCLDEDAKDTTLLLQNLKDLADKKLGANNWLAWDRQVCFVREALTPIYHYKYLNIDYDMEMVDYGVQKLS